MDGLREEANEAQPPPSPPTTHVHFAGAPIVDYHLASLPVEAAEFQPLNTSLKLAAGLTSHELPSLVPVL
ncbi:hypothetical protein VB005_03008 [Metarhizium brunneum]